ncbi:hypothetical protein HY251_10025 [bacterium]|nr:hypothetical protein [bacterium]
MTLRCPYCHGDVDETKAVCAACRAEAHSACVLELGRCAACGCADFEHILEDDGWSVVDASPGGSRRHVAFVRVAPRELATPGATSLRLDLARREHHEGGVLVGEATLSVARSEVLGALRVELASESTRSGFLGLLARRTRPLRALTLLGRGRGLYAPGTYRASFRLPLEGVPATRDEPGAPEHERLILSMRLDRRGGALVASGEVRVLARRAPALA